MRAGFLGLLVSVVALGAVCGCETTGGSVGRGFGRRSGEAWTIECLAMSGERHRVHAEQIAEVLRVTPWVDKAEVRVVSETDISRVYYGMYYRAIDRLRDERGLPAKLASDLGMIRDLTDGRGLRMFTAARMVPVPLADVGPSEWNLANAAGVYTLQVGVFFQTKGVANHKSAAVVFVKELRARGYEAYYYHTDSKSMVTVGVFGEEAVNRRKDGTNITEYSSRIRRMQRDELLKYNLTNGAVWYQIHEGQKVPVRSQLVRIPQLQGAWTQ